MASKRLCTQGELEQVMDRYSAAVYRLAYSHTRNAADAQDISQEVFLRYYQKRPEFASEEHRRAWLLRVTVNRAKSLVTSAWFRHTVPLEEEICFPEPEVQDLSMALGTLSAKERTLLHLFYYEELSTWEMAQILGRKESTVRTQLTRARQSLKNKLKGEPHESSLPKNE